MVRLSVLFARSTATRITEHLRAQGLLPIAVFRVWDSYVVVFTLVLRPVTRQCACRLFWDVLDSQVVDCSLFHGLLFSLNHLLES